MDRASDSGSEGWGFESLPAYQIKKRDTHPGIPLLYFALRAGGTRTHLHASVRWTLAETSANTGFYIYFIPALRGKKTHIESLLACLFSLIENRSAKCAFL